MPSTGQIQGATRLAVAMSIAANVSGGEFVEWSQFLLTQESGYSQWLGKGHCYGFSMFFLNCHQRGDSYLELATAEQLEGSNTYQHPHLLQQEIIDASLTAGIDTADGNDVHNYMLNNYGFRHVLSTTFGSIIKPGSFERFGAFIAESTFFYLIEIPGHAMAVVSLPGYKQFFDPNAGIVTCYSQDSLRQFVLQYMGSIASKSIYGGGHKFAVKVRRYRISVAYQ